MKAICKRELRALFGSMRGWGYVAIVLLGAAISLFVSNVGRGATRFEINLGYMALFYIPATALATMGSYAGEKRQNTERLLYSLPLKNSDIALGKLIALMGPMLAASAGLCLFPLFLSFFGMTALPLAYVSILALTLMGAACMAVGLLVSCCARNQLLAFIGTVLVLALSWAAPFLGEKVASVTAISLVAMICMVGLVFVLVQSLSGSGVLGIILAAVAEIPLLLGYLRGSGDQIMKALGGAVSSLSLFDPLNGLVNGLLTGDMLVFYIMVTLLFAVLTILCMQNRRAAKRRAL